MTPPTTISAAIAACDRPAGVLRCLAGLFDGEVLPAEIIVVDQSRDDAVAAALAQAGPTPVPVRHVRMPRRGLSASRNAALGCATEALIAFTDDDCVPDSGWIAAVQRVLAADAELAAVTGRVLPLGEERPGTYVVSPRTSSEPREYAGRAVPWTVGTGGNFAARRTWLERVGGFDERLGAGSPGRAAEDADLLYRLLRAGARVRYEPGSVVFHERQTAVQRLSSRQGYGHGIGALCGLYLRRGDLYAGRMLGGYLLDQAGGLARSVLRRDWFLTRQRLGALKGCATGFRYGLRLP
jgi:GT2 family glycosyltransferase